VLTIDVVPDKACHDFFNGLAFNLMNHAGCPFTVAILNGDRLDFTDKITVLYDRYFAYFWDTDGAVFNTNAIGIIHGAKAIIM
jgi:hypothetical protein